MDRLGPQRSEERLVPVGTARSGLIGVKRLSVENDSNIYANDPWVHTGHPTDPLGRRFKGIVAANNIEFDVLFMQEVASNLYVGGCTNGLVLPPFIDHLVSLYAGECYTVEHDLITELSVLMRDATNQSTNRVDSLAHWINECREDGPVLVHCQAGLNRSPLVVARALYHSAFDESVEHVGKDILSYLRAVRSPAVLCNKTFEAEVLSWEI